MQAADGQAFQALKDVLERSEGDGIQTIGTLRE